VKEDSQRSCFKMWISSQGLYIWSAWIFACDVGPCPCSKNFTD